MTAKFLKNVAKFCLNKNANPYPVTRKPTPLLRKMVNELTLQIIMYMV
jgi:hypothetical protein